jgi:hypothetical protein
LQFKYLNTAAEKPDIPLTNVDYIINYIYHMSNQGAGLDEGVHATDRQAE